MFNRNNYLSMKDLPFFQKESYIQKEYLTYVPPMYKVGGGNMKLPSIISTLDDKQQTLKLLNSQISSLKSVNTDINIINGMESAKKDILKQITVLQGVISKNVELKDFTELYDFLSKNFSTANDRIPIPIPIQRQMNFLKNLISVKQ